MEKKGRIGIPRALMFYRYAPFWQTFFEALGWEAVFSDGLGKKGKLLAFEDSCLPMKLLVTHAHHLAEQVDRLFIPRLISLHSKYILCPKFRGAPDIVRLATEGKVSILDETVDLRTRAHTLQKAFLRVGQALGASGKEIKEAIRSAEQAMSIVHKEWGRRINRLPARDLFRSDVPTPDAGKEQGLRVAFVGHPYNLYDTDINKDTLGLARSLGMEILSPEILPEETIERQLSGFSKEIYWSTGREIVGSLFHFLSGGADGVVLMTSFKCGIDALLQEFVKRMLRLRGAGFAPFLVLSFDEHTGREGLTTRLEAFKDVMEQRRH